VLDGYKFVGSVIAEEIFTGSMMVNITVRLNLSLLFQVPSCWGGGVLGVILPNVEFGLCL